MNSRELKFRIWDKKNKKFFEPTFEAHKGKVEDLTITPSGELIKRTMKICSEHESMFKNQYIIEQYSTIKSHHDQEIYEGDVISWNVKTDEVRDKRLSAIVEFVDGCFMAAGRPLIMLFSFNVISDITVDTNIHESPELV